MLRVISSSCFSLVELFIEQGHGKLDEGMQCVASSFSVFNQNLKTLEIPGVAISAASIEGIASSLPNLTKLNLWKVLFTFNNIEHLSAASFSKLASLRNLTELNLSWCENIDFSSLAVFTSVKYLTLDFCSKNVNSTSLPFIVAGFPNLYFLSLRAQYSISDTALAHVESLECLEHLIFESDQVSNDGLISLLNNGCKRLSAATLICREATDEFLLQTIPRLKKFAFLDILGCGRITHKVVLKVLDECPRIVLREHTVPPRPSRVIF